MTTRTARALGALPLFMAASLALHGCSEAGPSGTHPVPPSNSANSGGGSSAILRLLRVTNGFGQILPHRAPELDAAGNPTGRIVEIRSISDVRNFAQASDSILPPEVFPTAAVLPSGQPGNHFLLARFTSAIDPETVFDLSAGTGLARSVSLTTFDSTTGVRTTVPARVLVGGVTAVQGASGPALRTWARFLHDPGLFEAILPEAAGIPDVPGRRRLVAENSILLVADSDDDLLTFESFPAGAQLDLRLGSGILNVNGNALEGIALASTTIGLDNQRPSVVTDATGALQMQPANGDTDVDPQTHLELSFSEPIQPRSLGELEGAGLAVPGPSIDIGFGPSTSRTRMPYTLEPMSPYDLSRYRVIPAYAFPGAPSPGVSTPFTTVDVGLVQGLISDLALNLAFAGPTAQFETGVGPGLVNAPVTPEAIMAFGPGIAGTDRLSVIDLNGFGASTGNPVSSLDYPREGESRFPFDPNVRFNPLLRPPVQPGTTTIDGGSAGVFTLTLDSSLQPELVGGAILESIVDVHTGHPLDPVFNNAPPPFGCQAGGGQICTVDGLKVIALEFNGANGLRPTVPSAFGGLNPGYGNVVSMTPHPNPPPLSFPPLCSAPLLLGQQPTQVSPLLNNLLVTGNPFPVPSAGIPPTGLLTLEQSAFFQGPTFGATQLSQCSSYMVRQQVGHFVYVADRAANEIVVLNSNRMTVVDRIPVADPTSMAMSPNLDLIAVTGELAGQVTFVDINPSSARFHQVVQSISVGDSPRGIAWGPGNEDILVCNEGSDTLSIVSAQSLQVRRTVAVPAGGPFEVSVTPRDVGFSFNRGVYLGYVLCRDGSVAVFESGPNGLNGWGFDEVIGILPYRFQNPRTIQSDRTSSPNAVAIAHEGPIDPVTGAAGVLGDGAITRLFIESAPVGIQPLLPGETPSFRQVAFGVKAPISMSGGQLSGIPTDIAFDEMVNLGGLIGVNSVFSAGSPLPANSKDLMKREGLNFRRATSPQLLFAAVPGQGVIDVVSGVIGSSPTAFDVDPYRIGTQSIIAPGVSSLSSYWRQ